MEKRDSPGRTRRKVVIVGGAAGGASCAARLRRLDEHAEIILVESGPYVSYANCGLPHLITGVIPDEAELLAISQKTLGGVLGIDVRTRCEATFVSPKKKRVHLRDLEGSGATTESYDILVLAPGAVPVRPALPGIDLPGIFSLRTIADVRAIREWMARGTRSAPGKTSPVGIAHAMPLRHAVVVGGGVIGLEAAENLAREGFEVTVVEMLDQVLAPLDREIARLAQEHLTRHGVRLALGDPVAGFRQRGFGALEVTTRRGASHPADIVILALGARPDTTLARTAELEIGELGGIRVDEEMRTGDPNIFAVGDSVEVKDYVTGHWTLAALASTASRQGRVAADVIAGCDSRFRGSQATSIVVLFGAAAACTGVSEKRLCEHGDEDYEKVYLFPNADAGHDPGATPIALKVVFRVSDGRVLGAQAMGEDAHAVDKRISALAVAIQMGATIHDLEQVELCCAPQFGGARDPLNYAGMIAANVQRGDMPIARWEDAGECFVLDVRDASEAAAHEVPGAVKIPLDELRSRLGELPRDVDILVVSRSAQRAYHATRILLQCGFRARTAPGGLLARAILMPRETGDGDLLTQAKKEPQTCPN